MSYFEDGELEFAQEDLLRAISQQQGSEDEIVMGALAKVRETLSKQGGADEAKVFEAKEALEKSAEESQEATDQTRLVDSALLLRLGGDGPGGGGEGLERNISGLRDADYTALLKTLEGQPAKLACKCAGPDSKRHAPPQLVLQQVEAMAEALRGRSAEASTEAKHYATLCQRLREETTGLEAASAAERAAQADALVALQGEEAAAQAAYDAALLRLEEARAAAAAQLEQQATVEERALAEAKRLAEALELEQGKRQEAESHHAHVAALQARAQAVRDAKQAEWQRFQDKVCVANCLQSFSQDEMQHLLIALGRCDWSKAFADNDVTAAMLPRMSASMISGMVKPMANGGAPGNGASFGDIRSFCLAVKGLEAGEGLPDATVLAGGTDDATRPVDMWSVTAVARHFEGRAQESKEEDEGRVAAQCRALGISGAVLLSMSGEDIGSQMQLDVAAALKFQEAVAELKARPLPPAPNIGGGRAGRVSAAVVQALMGDGQPAEFSIKFVRRCTNGFSGACVVGRGAFGQVYRGMDPVSGVRFAVKRISNEAGAALASPRQRRAAEESLRRELEVLLTVRHPHMIKLLGYTKEEPICLIYELGEHGSVADNLASDERAQLFHYKARVRALTALASVLNYMHRSHSPPVFHRDVKSSNLVLARGMDVKLIDCGLAKLLTEEQEAEHAAGAKSVFTMAGTMAGGGTAGYMCPRYQAGGKFGGKSEVFSFGVVVLELLTGRLNETVEEGLYNYYTNPVEQEKELALDDLDDRAGQWPAELGKALIAIATRSTGAHRRRPTMQQMLSELRELERRFCALSVGEVQLRMAAVQEQNQALVEERKQELTARYRDEEKERRAEAEDKLARQRTCCICYDEVDFEGGVECASGQEKHFTCADCFGEHVLAESAKEIRSLQARKGKVFCPLTGHGCASEEPFEERQVAAHCRAAVFGAFMQAQQKLQEQRLVQEYEQRLNAERERIARMKADELQLEQMRLHVLERLLTLKCPRCDAAFLDFQNCFALTCHRCNCGFCAYCLHDCGADAHRHVANCESNTAPGRNVFGEMADFEAAQRTRRQRLVEQYLATIEDVDMRARLVAACAQEFADLGMAVRN